jgi:hypothetical protein
MILRNYSAIHQVLGRQFGGLTSPVTYRKPEVMRNYFSQPENRSEQLRRDSFPTGTNPPYSLVMGDKGGLLSATTTISGSGAIASNLVMGRAMTADLTGTSTLSASGSSIVQLAAALFGTSTVTANMVGVVTMAAILAGSGSLTAGLGMIARLQAALSGSGSLTGNLKGKAGMSADIFVNSGTATTNELVAAIWAAIAADNNVSGTMGQKLNGAASAGDPWSTELPGTYTGDQAGAIVDRLEALIKQVKALAAAGI